MSHAVLTDNVPGRDLVGVVVSYLLIEMCGYMKRIVKEGKK